MDDIKNDIRKFFAVEYIVFFYGYEITTIILYMSSVQRSPQDIK